MTSRQRHSNRLKCLTPLLLLVAFPAAVFAQQAQYYQGPPPPPDGYSGQYDPGQQYQQPYGQPDYDQPQADYDQPQPDYGAPQALGAAQLEQLVAPLALNPDPLVALMLAASTYPAQISQADEWREAQGNAPPEQIAYGANMQAWDPSVKALTAFPQVLAEMDRNIQWTGALGNAYYNQPEDVLQAIQIMRQRAESAGTLESTPQQEVNYDQGNIELMPANPQVVYVPAYDPWTAYGQPVSPYPGFSLLGAIGSFFNSSFGSSAMQFGVGSVMSAFGSTPWGLLSWGLNWLTNSVLFNNSDYYSNSRSVSDWGLPYGGPRAYMHRGYAGYNRGFRNGYNRDYRNGYNRDYRNGFNRDYRTTNYNRERQQGNYGNRSYHGYGSGYRAGLYNRTPSPFADRNGYGSNRSSYNRGYSSGFADRSHPGSYGGSDTRLAYRGNNLGYGNRNSFANGNRNNFANGNRNNYAYGNRGNYAYGNRANMNGFENSNRNRESYRAPSSGFNQSKAYRGNSFAGYGKPSHSGGFFGGGHNNFGHQQKFKAPKYKAPKMHGGGGHHLFGGGGHHSGGHHH